MNGTTIKQGGYSTNTRIVTTRLVAAQQACFVSRSYIILSVQIEFRDINDRTLYCTVVEIGRNSVVIWWSVNICSLQFPRYRANVIFLIKYYAYRIAPL